MTKTTTKLGLIVLAVATVSSAGLAMAKDRDGREARGGDGQRAGMMRILQDVDQNNDGAFSRDEVTAFVEARFTEADADQSASLTAEEIAEAMPQRRGGEGRRGEARGSEGRGGDRAERMMMRVDINDDGSVTLAEVQDRQEKLFALLDVDNSGVIDADEMPMRGRDGRRSDK